MHSIRSLDSVKIRFVSHSNWSQPRNPGIVFFHRFASSSSWPVTSPLTRAPQAAPRSNSPLPRTFATSRCRLDMQEVVNGSLVDEVLSKRKIDIPGGETTLADLCALLHSRVTHFLDSTPNSEVLRNVQEQIRGSLRAIEQALKKYSLEQLALSYNGGKDCLVLLILYLVGLHSHYIHSPTSDKSGPFPKSLDAIYIQTSHPFYEVDEFVETSAKQYHLALVSAKRDLKQAFEEYLQSHQEVKAIFVGTRRTDPHGGKLTHFDRTDRGWPDFVRIHPVIDWHYREIWAFIRHFDIPYCSLYDLGYTSLGGTTDTKRNPRLKSAFGPDSEQFRPAFELLADEEERLGREK